jgi:hypothetical protein
MPAVFREFLLHVTSIWTCAWSILKNAGEVDRHAGQVSTHAALIAGRASSLET